jgi:hypothetical protein
LNQADKTLVGLQRWLEVSGYQKSTFFPDMPVFYQYAPDWLQHSNSVSFVIITTLPVGSGVNSLISLLKQEFDDCLIFFKKNKKNFSRAASFQAFFGLIGSDISAELKSHFLSSKPPSSSYIGSHIPILMDATTGETIYFAKNSPTASSSGLISPLDKFIHLTFQTPLVPPIPIDSSLLSLVEILRQKTPRQRDRLDHQFAKKSLGDLQNMSNQLLFQGKMRISNDWHKELLFHTYLEEFLLRLELSKEIGLERNLTLTSLLSRDVFFEDLYKDLEAVFLKNFNKSFRLQVWLDDINRIRKELVDSGYVVCKGICNNCGEIELDKNLRCPNGRFHQIKEKYFFDRSELSNLTQ